MMVMAFDPGRTTGYAIAVRNETTYYVACGQERFDHKEFWDFISVKNPEYIICESFHYRRDRLDVDLYPCEIIGVLHLYCQFADKTPYMQQPSIQGEKKAFFSDAKLKEMGVYNASAEHGRSALKHLLWWFKFGSGFQFFQNDTEPEMVDEVWLNEEVRHTS